MKLDRYNQAIAEETDVISGLYSGKLTDLSSVMVDNQPIVDQVNQSIALNADSINKIKLYVEPTCTIEEFDLKNQAQWFIPEDYQQMHIEEFLLGQCKTEEETERVLQELELFFQHNMIDVLIYLKYLVDYMRKNNIVWGLGRGSSVASFCLYLIGVHKVDSIKYQLDIKEFLKGE